VSENKLFSRWDVLRLTKKVAKEIVQWIHEADETALLPDDESIEFKVEELLKQEEASR